MYVIRATIVSYEIERERWRKRFTKQSKSVLWANDSAVLLWQQCKRDLWLIIPRYLDVSLGKEGESARV